MITAEEVAQIQEQLGRLSIMAAEIDLDAFIEVANQIGSPQALAAGIDPRAVGNAPEWAEMARLLKPFRDQAVQRVDRARTSRSTHGLERHYGPDDETVRPELACPGCGERRVDELTLNEDGSVVCATCGKRYSVAGEEQPE